MARRNGARHTLKKRSIPKVRASVARGALEPYSQPGYYDRAYASRREDVEYYLGEAQRSGGPVLEYGTGTGRVALPLLAAGLEVVGVDHSKDMLAAFRAKLKGQPELAERIELVRGDMRKRRLGRQFPLVIAPFNAVLHLYSRSDLERFFSRVKEHLAPNGRFVFDFSVPQVKQLSASPDRWYGGPRVRHPELGQTVRYAERFHYAPHTQVLSVWMRFIGADGTTERVLTHRQFYPQEMDALLHYNGFVDVRWSADFDGSELGPDSDTAVVSCGLPGGELARAGSRTRKPLGKALRRRQSSHNDTGQG